MKLETAQKKAALFLKKIGFHYHNRSWRLPIEGNGTPLSPSEQTTNRLGGVPYTGTALEVLRDLYAGGFPYKQQDFEVFFKKYWHYDMIVNHFGGTRSDGVEVRVDD